MARSIRADLGLSSYASNFKATIRGGTPVPLVVGYPGPSSSSGTSLAPIAGPIPPKPRGAVRFVNDTSFNAQTETSVGALRYGPLAANVAVMGSFNDYRAFFCPGSPTDYALEITCQDPYTGSLTGWTFSKDNGRHVFKGGLVPGVYTPNTVVNQSDPAHGNDTVSWRQWAFGDPVSLPFCTGPLPSSCGFYQVSLALNPFFGTNGIELSVSDYALLADAGTNCTTTDSVDFSDYFGPETSPCFTSALVYGNTTIGFDYNSTEITPPTTQEDKPTAVVVENPDSLLYGSIFIGWDHFNPDGTSDSYLALCSPSLSCTMYSGGGMAVASSPDDYAAWTTPAVDSAGNVYVAWCNYGTLFSIGPVECRERSVLGPGSYGSVKTIFSFMGPAGDVPLSRQLPDTYVIQGFATEQFRTANVMAFGADKSGKSGLSGELYFAIAVCTSGNFYALSATTDFPGACGYSEIVFANSPDSGTTWSGPRVLSKPAVNIQPTLTVDKASGVVTVLWYTAVYDRFNHRLDVQDAKSANGGATFATKRLTSVSNEPSADPLMFSYLSPFGGSWAAPQFGDYMGAYALGGKVYVLFSANYAAIATPEGTTTQVDPWLIVAVP